MDIYGKAVAAALREAKGAAQLSNPKIAKASGIPLVSVQRYFAGTREPVTSDLKKLASTLGVDPVDLLHRAQERVDREQSRNVDPD